MAKLGKISYYIEHQSQRTPKRQSKMGNPENVTTRRRKKTQHNMCWTPLYVNEHKRYRQDMSPTTHNWR